MPGRDDLEAARRRVLDALAAFSEQSGARMTCVFDGVDLPYPDRGAHRGVAVRFSRKPQDADRLIGSLLDATDHARETTVVSSDRAVQARAKAAGAKILSSDDFGRLLNAGPARKAAARPDVAVSPSEVAGWAKAFGVDPEAGMPARVAPVKPKPKGKGRR